MKNLEKMHLTSYKFRGRDQYKRKKIFDVYESNQKFYIRETVGILPIRDLDGLYIDAVIDLLQTYPTNHLKDLFINVPFDDSFEMHIDGFRELSEEEITSIKLEHAKIVEDSLQKKYNKLQKISSKINCEIKKIAKKLKK